MATVNTCQHPQKLVGIKILLKKRKRDPGHDGNALDGINSVGWLRLPPGFSLFPVGLNGVRLRLWELESVEPLCHRGLA